MESVNDRNTTSSGKPNQAVEQTPASVWVGREPSSLEHLVIGKSKLLANLECQQRAICANAPNGGEDYYGKKHVTAGSHMRRGASGKVWSLVDVRLNPREMTGIKRTKTYRLVWL